MKSADKNCSVEKCGCGSGLNRRDFVKSLGWGAAAAVTQSSVMAGPFTSADFENWIPADKKLDANWVKSLFARGAPSIYRGKDLKWIGMPVGGICTGQVYLGGDGKLWHWDIFNQGKKTDTQGSHYAKPPEPSAPLEQGFALKVGDQARALDHSGFTDISFCGQYPIGTVDYKDPALPVAVTLEAFSPFIPLETATSSLPATVMQFTVRNTSGAAVEATLTGTLENAVCLDHRSMLGTRRNRIVTGATFTLLECEVDSNLDKNSGPALDKLNDFGTMALMLLGNPAEQATAGGAEPKTEASAPLAEKLVGSLSRTLTLAPGQSTMVSFVLTWRFPNRSIGRRFPNIGQHYATRFDSASAVARQIAVDFERLTAQTRLWRDTWCDSSLPHWFLDRTFLNVSSLATATSHRFRSGRFWGWEGVGCCHGTCTHVWHYAQAVARLFPELERDLRERTDFGLAFDTNTGVINHRGEEAGLAVDGQAGCILRAYREHQMSADDAFLKRNWPNIRKATQCLIDHDTNADGMLDGPQRNTLDAEWFGRIAWLSSMYVAALRAGEAMASEMGDEEFAKRTRILADAGSTNIEAQLFNGEYYLQIPDAEHAKTVGSYDGCEIDQVLGQSWAWQVGLGRILPQPHVKTALASLWKYNFVPDVGPYRDAHKPGRWYAMAGEAGLLMCSWPKGDAARVATGYDFYLNECMTGFEYQAAGHMIWEDMVLEGLAVTRAIHDRYHPSRRNPWNEVECGDHYARAMASYGVFLAACGFEYHGPKAHIGFAPRVGREDFKAPFTTAEGWGTYSQKLAEGESRFEIALKHGTLRLQTLTFEVSANTKVQSAAVVINGQKFASQVQQEGRRATIKLAAAASLQQNQTLTVSMKG